MFAAKTIVSLLTAYAAAGVAFAICFVTTGIDVIDEAARTSGWGFRLMVVPGTMALWPLLLTKWLRARRSAK